MHHIIYIMKRLTFMISDAKTVLESTITVPPPVNRRITCKLSLYTSCTVLELLFKLNNSNICLIFHYSYRFTFSIFSNSSGFPEKPNTMLFSLIRALKTTLYIQNTTWFKSFYVGSDTIFFVKYQLSVVVLSSNSSKQS